MTKLNLAITLLLVLLISQTSLARSMIHAVLGQYLPGLDQNYQVRYENEKEKRTFLEAKLAELEKNLISPSPELRGREIPPTFNYSGEEIFSLINEFRRKAHVGELSLDPNLCFLASLRLSQLLDLGKLDAHQGFIEFNPTTKFKYERVGENLAYGYPTARSVVEAWEKSPGHNLTLKDPVNSLGCVASNQGFAIFIAGREH